MTRQLVRLAVPAGALTADGATRTLAGIILPWSVPRRDHLGMQFDAGSLTWAEDVTRIPLLFQHDHNTTIGHTIALESRPEGLHGTFAVEDTPTGDRAMREAEAGSRTGFSVGVLLDPASIEAWWTAPVGESVPVTGELAEVSHVSVPAFDDARIDTLTQGTRPADTSAGLAGGTTTKETLMGTRPAAAASMIVTADLSTPPAQPAPQPPAPAAPAVAPAAATSPAPAPEPVPAAPVAPAQPAPAMPALAGAQVLSEAATYAPGGEHSFVRDAFRARLDGDAEAAARIRRFNAELVTAAVAVRSGFSEVIPPGYRGELMVEAIDRGRPIVSRLISTPLTDATPFKIPVEGEFDGVGDHVEGTAHVAAGTLTVDETTISPKAISGAFEVSRELVDSSNPAIDRIAINAMLRDYRTTTEAYAATTLAAAATTVHGGKELEAQIIDFLDDRDASPVFIACAPGFFIPIATEEAADGRPRYPYLGPTNASGTTSAGFTGVNVQGVPLIRAGQVATAKAQLVVPEDFFWGESSVGQFRFDEVLGPGVIKLALFAYVAAAKLRASGLRTLAYVAPAG